MQLKTYSSKERNMYLTAMFGKDMMYNVINMFTNYFAKDVLFIPAMTVGVIMTIAQVWDAVNDPIMGTIVDKTRTKRGKCRPYLMISPALIYVFTMLLFLCRPYRHDAGALSGHNVMVVVWALVGYIFVDVSYTMGDIPLWGITALMTENEKHRQKLQALARVIGGIGGGISIALFQPIALQFGQWLGKDGLPNDRGGSLLTAFILLTVGAVTFQLAGLFVKEKIVPQNKGNSMTGNFKMLWENKPFRQILMSGILGSPRNLIGLVTVPLVTYYFASKDPAKALIYTAIFGIAIALGQFPVQTLSHKLLERYSKRNLYIFSNLIEVPANILLFLLFLASLGVRDGLTNPVMIVLVFLIFFVKGAASGLFYVLQANMIADAVDYEDYTNHQRPDGVFFSGLTFMAKIGNGVSNMIYQALSAMVGLSGMNIKILQNMIDTGGIPRDLMKRGSQTVVHRYMGGALTGNQLFKFFGMMIFAISILPAIACVLSSLPMRRYALPEDKYAEILGALQERRRLIGELAED
ncbi:MAG: MFS transporter [Oscillospiraceae bacterium]|nr:MFS transporter [Oscillospiraceae bacterium]